jgi:CRP/FNR family transcriptional regulator
MEGALFPALFCGAAANALELRELQGMATQVYVGSGKTIFSEGEQADSVYGLSHGVVRLYKQLTDGRRQVLSFALAGDFLGMPIAERHKLSADAVGEVSLSQFSRNDLLKFIASSPNLMRLLVAFANRELDMAQDQLLLLGNASAEAKVVIFLVGWRNRLARSSASSSSKVVPLPMRRRDIADFLGLKLETVSRTFAKLEQKNVLRIVPKGIYLTGLEETVVAEGEPASRSSRPEKPKLPVRSTGPDQDKNTR